MLSFEKKRILGGPDKKTVENTYSITWEPQSRIATFTEEEAKKVVEELAKLLKKK